MYEKKIRWLSLFGLIFISLLVLSCHSESTKKKTQQILTVYPTSHESHLYYSGVIKPLKEELIISPASGIVSKINFHYGDYVQKGELLFTIHSPETESEFRDAISNYLRVKQTYLNSKNSMLGSEMLHKEKIISDQEYANEKSQYQNNILGYIEASAKLKRFLNYLPAYQQKMLDLPFLNLEDAEKILRERVEDLTIFAQSSGIILFPEENNTQGTKELRIGSEIKKDVVLLEIGNLSGLSITTNVSENDIHHIKPGLPVQLSFLSNRELELKGTIVSVAKQARNVENSGLSTFPVIIQVPTISERELQLIRVGMNAKIDIVLKEPASIKLPLRAIIQKEETTLVTIVDPISHKPKQVPIKTGSTDLNDVTILEGLRQGDKVIVE